MQAVGQVWPSLSLWILQSLLVGLVNVHCKLSARAFELKSEPGFSSGSKCENRSESLQLLQTWKVKSKIRFFNRINFGFDVGIFFHRKVSWRRLRLEICWSNVGFGFKVPRPILERHYLQIIKNFRLSFESWKNRILMLMFPNHFNVPFCMMWLQDRFEKDDQLRIVVHNLAKKIFIFILLNYAQQFQLHRFSSCSSSSSEC